MSVPDASTQLVLDKEIRNWVLLPLTVSVFLLLLLRQFASVFLAGLSKPSAPASAADNVDVPGSDSKNPESSTSNSTRAEYLRERRQKSILGRVKTMKTTSAVLTPSGFSSRISYFTDPTSGVLHEKTEKKDMTEMLIANPDAMNGMMKQQLGGLGPQLALGAFVNYFFRGFVLGKLPFALSPKFRGMLQSGIDLPSLDVSYLSSLSYYMLLLFGSRGILTLFFKDVVNDAAMAQQMQMGMGSGMGGGGMLGGPDIGKQMEGEAKAMDLLQYKPWGAGAEARALSVLLEKTRRQV